MGRFVIQVGKWFGEVLGVIAVEKTVDSLMDDEPEPPAPEPPAPEPPAPEPPAPEPPAPEPPAPEPPAPEPVGIDIGMGDITINDVSTDIHADTGAISVDVDSGIAFDGLS